MKRLALAFAVAAATVATLAPAAGASSTGDKQAVAAFRRDVQRESDGQFGLTYQTMVPTQRAQVTKAVYVDCAAKALAPGVTLSVVKVKAVYHETVTIPGTVKPVPSTAITAVFRLTSGAQRQDFTRTGHEFKVKGHWYWANTADQLTAYKTGTCPQ